MDNLLGYALSAMAGATLAAIFFGVWIRRRRGKGPDPAELRRRVMRGAYKALESDFAGAAEEFGAVAQSDPDSSDVYFVMGRLFRRAGQFARAARVHQNLILRHDDKKGEIKKRALFELAEDYRAAQMLDRAVNTFAELVELAPQWLEPLQNLVELAIKGRFWSVAVTYIPRLEKLAGKVDDELAAHVLAEYALLQIEQGNPEEARKTLKLALKRSPRLAHVAFSFAYLHADAQKPKAVIVAMQEALDDRPDVLPLVLDALHRLATDHDFLERFDEFLADRGDDADGHWSVTLHRALRQRELGNDSKARELIRDLIRQGVDIPPVRQQATELMLALPEEWPQQERPWTCRRCQAAHQQLDWFCSSCSGWGTLDVPHTSKNVS
jgi:lipopolysaccharide biosynthesis regulator YciM